MTLKTKFGHELMGKFWPKDYEAQLLTRRCMRQTCGFAAVPAATAAQQRDRVGDFSNSEIDCEAKRKVKKEVKEG